MTDEPTRGERSNNPGCMNEGGGWIGDIGYEIVPPGFHYKPRFARFDTAIHGIRAIAKQLIVYQDKHGLHTIRAMINRWAPPSDDNDTSAYVEAVSGHVGVTPDETINVHDIDILLGMVCGIINQENGRVIYGQDDILTACTMAL